MNRIIFQVFLVIVSVALFFTVADPLYRSEDPVDPGIKKIKEEVARYDEAINKSEELVREKNKLLASKNAMSEEDRNRLERLLPDSIDNIRLVIDINNIARPYGIVLKGLRFTGDKPSASSGETKSNVSNRREIAIGGNETTGSVTLGFSVTARYQTFKEFLHDLENSLRLVDVTSVAVKNSNQDFYDFDVAIKTYWLR